MASIPNTRPAPAPTVPGAAPAPEGAVVIDFTQILSQVPGEAITSGPGLPGAQPTVDLAPAETAPDEGAAQPEGSEEGTGEEGTDENATIMIAQQIADLVPIVLAQGVQPVAVTIPVPAATMSTEPAVPAAASARAALPGPVAPTNLPAQVEAVTLLTAANDPAPTVEVSEARPSPRAAVPIATAGPPAAQTQPQPQPQPQPQTPQTKAERPAPSKAPSSRPFASIPSIPPGARTAANAPMPPLPVLKPRPNVAAIAAGTDTKQPGAAKAPAPKRVIAAAAASPERVTVALPLTAGAGPTIAAPVETDAKQPASTKPVAVQPGAEAQLAPVADQAATAIQPAATLLTTAPFPAGPLAATGPAPGPLAPSPELAIERELDLAHEGEWLDRLARDIVRAGANEGAMRFRLHPQTLGHLQVELSQGDHGTSIRVSVETEAARAILVDAQPRLLAEARAQGVRVAGSEVDLFGSGHHSGSDPRRQADGPQTPFIRTARATGSEAAQAAGDPAPSRSDRYA
jgi:flagellar hook-length control protein FliK